MSKGDPYIHYRHRLDHNREAVAFLTQGKARSDLDTDRMSNLALMACSTSRRSPCRAGSAARASTGPSSPGHPAPTSKLRAF